MRPCKSAAGAADRTVQVRVQREPARLDEQRAPAIRVLDHPRRADVRLRVHERRKVAELAR